MEQYQAYEFSKGQQKSNLDAQGQPDLQLWHRTLSFDPGQASVLS